MSCKGAYSLIKCLLDGVGGYSHAVVIMLDVSLRAGGAATQLWMYH
jgi:hypothetical protein